MQTILLWPNIDAGADHISKAIRVFRDKTKSVWLRTLTNLSPENYLKVLANAACAIGNSSSFVRDAGYFGTPIVLVGSRQEGREADEHVVRVPPHTVEVGDDGSRATYPRPLCAEYSVRRWVCVLPHCRGACLADAVRSEAATLHP